MCDFFRGVSDSDILGGISEAQASGGNALRNCFFPFELMRQVAMLGEEPRMFACGHRRPDRSI